MTEKYLRQDLAALPAPRGLRPSPVPIAPAINRQIQVIFWLAVLAEVASGGFAIVQSLLRLLPSASTNLLAESPLRQLVLTNAQLIPLIPGGVLCILCAIVGAIGALRRIGNNRMLYWFVACLSLLALYKVVYGIAIWFSGINPRGEFADKWPTWSLSMRDTVQADKHCCGYDDPTDFPAPSKMCPADGQNATFGGCITELATYATETRNRLYEPLFITVAVEMVALIVSVLLIQARNTVERWKIRAARSFQPYQRSPVQEGQYSYMTN